MQSLHNNQIWKLASLLKGKKTIGCKWVFAKKEGFPGQDKVRYKARLVAKGYAQKENFNGFGGIVGFGTSSAGCKNCFFTWRLERGNLYDSAIRIQGYIVVIYCASKLHWREILFKRLGFKRDRL
ncbi:Retrovirus-related Pol polyprotein from transposon TNT 1-94 [Gossypium australe]|uniref:Retrovirus-related Pol polyprotein from transposon TNT 1-94 n=1 Tax=Gossypium australe TaxID=47621 RepID=A0A5B6UK90_9ROSI|nr:Retrovirus-related Pol polyprotein from transposon TNT 1-94 [Gossypium australe]